MYVYKMTFCHLDDDKAYIVYEYRGDLKRIAFWHAYVSYIRLTLIEDYPMLFFSLTEPSTASETTDPPVTWEAIVAIIMLTYSLLCACVSQLIYVCM